jgi:hypothetical protein
VYVHLPPELARVASRQAGVVSRRQLAGRLNDASVRHRLRSADWQHLFPGTYATFTGPVPPLARMWAAVLYAGAGAVVSRETAAHAYRWQGAPALVDVSIPTGRRVREQPGLRIHRTALPAYDIATVQRLPATSPNRTVLDLAVSAATVDAALGLIADAVGGRRVSAEVLAHRIHEAQRFRWRQPVLDALADVADGSNSLLELRFAQLLRLHGLPVGVRQRRVQQQGRTVRVDMAWEGVVAELDGLLGHNRYADRHRDMQRDNGHVLADARVLRYGWSDVVTRPCDVAAQVAAVLRVTARHCGPTCRLG